METTKENTEEVVSSDSKPKPKKVAKKKQVINKDPFYVKKTPKVKRNIELSMKKVKGIINHIQNVQDNAILLSEKLIEIGHVDLGVKLIKHAFQHDVSKFSGIEWENMAPGIPLEAQEAKAKLKMAIYNHNRCNPHHPEYWVGGIREMPLEYLAEMACDWKSRSEEFGTALREYIDEKALKRWGFEKTDEVYKNLMWFVDLLCEKPFA